MIRLLALASTVGLLGLAGCALDPVSATPEEAARREAAQAQDCARRGGVWNRDRRVCLGADLR